MKILPPNKPLLTKDELIKIIADAHPGYELPKICWVGIRGYYKKTMGSPDGNDRAIYDDAIFILADNDYHTFNGNCDPARFQRGIASLRPGIWPVYKFDKHKGIYTALCQRAGKVTVCRDNKGDDSGMFGINIHRGGSYGTSSAGCQTIPPSQWDDFIDKSMVLAKKYIGNSWVSSTYTYILLEQE
jgi:hypothetical protein